MNKKILLVIVILAGVILTASFLGYKYLGQIREPNTEKIEDVPKIEIQAESSTGNEGGLTICSDRCGDKICQKADPECNKDSLNCVCAETPQDCPQDCK